VISSDIATYLAGLGYGTLGTDLFYSAYPDYPEALTAVVDYPGSPPLYLQSGPLPAAERPRFQVVVRAGMATGGFDAAMAKAYQVFTDLSQVVDQVINGTYYLFIEPVQSPFLLARDPLNRPLVACNYAVERNFS
jgi:minor capsid protein